jgi:DNA-binding CsgD family transcriptional regulator/PAS domain-containing protein
MIRASQEAVSAVLGDIYQAAYEPATWPGVVESLRGMFQGSRACLVRIGPNRRPPDLIAPNSDPAFQNLYIEEFAHEPNVVEAAVAAAPVGFVYNDHAFIGPQKLRGSRLWNDWMAPQDMYGGLTCKLLASGPSSWFFDIQRGRNQAEFTAADADLFAFVAPHIRRSLEIGRQFQINQALSSAFSYLPFGIVLVDGARRIMALNEAAEAILARSGSALRDKAGHLVATDAACAATLERLVVEACSLRDGFAPGFGGDFRTAGGPHGGRAAILAVSVGPLTRPQGHAIPAEPCAVVVIREVTFELPAGFAQHMRGLFDLTAKEASLAAALAAGLSLKDAARDANIRFSTARTHLEHIFLKTGVRQQSQLVALLKSAQPILRRH